MGKIKYFALILFLFLEVLPNTILSQTTLLEVEKLDGKDGIEFSTKGLRNTGSKVILRPSNPKAVQDSFCCKFCVKCDCDDCPHYANRDEVPFIQVANLSMSTNLPNGMYSILLMNKMEAIDSSYKVLIAKEAVILMDEDGGELNLEAALGKVMLLKK